MTEPSECRWLFARLDLEDGVPPPHTETCPDCARRWRDARSARERLLRGGGLKLSGRELSGGGDERLPDAEAWRGMLDAIYEKAARPSEPIGRALRSVPAPSVPFPTAAEILRSVAEPSPALERALDQSINEPVATPGWLRARVRAAWGAADQAGRGKVVHRSTWQRYARAAAVLLVTGLAVFAAWSVVPSEHRNSPVDQGTLPEFEVVYVDAERPFDGSFAFHAALESLAR